MENHIYRVALYPVGLLALHHGFLQIREFIVVVIFSLSPGFFVGGVLTTCGLCSDVKVHFNRLLIFVVNSETSNYYDSSQVSYLDTMGTMVVRSICVIQ